MNLTKEKVLFGGLVILVGLVIAKQVKAYAAKNPESPVAKYLA